ncbi:MAG: mucoidy inhibitor MuiA family protein [Bacteroidetes bacterium CHB5]|nr:mucoidy inhibitor MuiA family protein [Bacteroidetes bacterium CHB5]
MEKHLGVHLKGKIIKIMTNQLLTSALVVSSLVAVAQPDKPVDSRITDVTVFLNKAQISRVIKTKVDAGKTNLIVTGLSSQLDPQSVQVSGKGGIIILGTSHRQNFLSEFNLPKPIRVLKDSVETLQRQLTLEQSQKEILNKEEQMLLSNQKIGGTNQNLTVAELKAMADFYRTRLGDIVSTRMKQDEKIKKLNERIAKLNKQINSENELYRRNTSELVVSVSSETTTNVELQVRYVVANAGWSPVYDLRAVDTKNPVQLSYKANVFQSTGEEWSNVKLKLSTANPNLSGQKPELYSWYLDFYYPTERSLQGRVAGVRVNTPAPVLMKMEKKAAEMADEELIAQSVSDYTSTIQTALNTEFDIALPYTVASSAKPVVVDIRNYDMKADYIYSVAPKLDVDAFLMARATGWEEFNLLPGEANIFFEGTFVGKSFIDPNNIKDTLAVSLGRDKRIVVKRDKLKDLTSKNFIGSSRKENYTWEISVRNTKTDAVKIIVEDQVPVSQNTQIEVTTVDLGGAKYNKDTGKLTWELELKPNETRKLVYKFEVKYPKDKQVSGL